MSKRHTVGYSSLLLLLLVGFITFSRHNSMLQREVLRTRTRLNWIESTATHLAEGRATLHVYAMPDTNGLLATFAGRSDVEMISLDNTDTTADGLRSIAAMPNIYALEFIASHDGIDDDAVSILSQCKNLRFLDLSGTSVTDSGVELLLAQLPNVTIGPFSLETIAESGKGGFR